MKHLRVRSELSWRRKDFCGGQVSSSWSDNIRKIQKAKMNHEIVGKEENVDKKV